MGDSLAMLRPRERKVKILATLGPASSTPEMIRALVEAGADAFRINMSHGSQAETRANEIPSGPSALPPSCELQEAVYREGGRLNSAGLTLMPRACISSTMRGITPVG